MSRILLTVCFLAMPAVICFADENENAKKKAPQKRSRDGSSQLLEQLKDVGLTEEQVGKVKELAKQTNMKLAAIKERVGITQEMTKKRAEVGKKLREAGDKKAAEVTKAINAELGYNEKQLEALKEMNAVRLGMRKSVIALLTKEQTEKLPESFTRGLKGKNQKGKKNNAKKAKASEEKKG